MIIPTVVVFCTKCGAAVIAKIEVDTAKIYSSEAVYTFKASHVPHECDDVQDS